MRVMLIDERPGQPHVLEQALQEQGYAVVARLGMNDDWRARVREMSPDVVIVDAAAPGRDLVEHLQSIGREQPRPIVLFAASGDSDTINAAVRAGVSAYVVDGLSKARIKPIVAVAIARFREFQALRTELARAQNDLKERKAIEKAKGILMRHRGVSEDEAYAALRKMAMDRNRRLGDVARDLITAAEMLS